MIEDLTLRDVLMRNVALYGQEPAVICADYRATWSELAGRVHQLANALHDTGIRHSDRIGALMPNSPELIEIAYAAAELGAVLVPISPRLAAPEITALAEDADLRTVFVAADQEELVTELGRRLVRTRCPDYDELVDSGSTDEPQRAESAGDVVLQIYTSGTTGRPKGVLMSQRAMMHNAYTVMVSQGLRHDDIFLTATPLTHAAAANRIFTLGFDGIRHVILEKFRVPDFLEAIATHQVTTTLLVPTMLRDLLDDPGLDSADLSSLRLIVYGAAPSPRSLIEEAVRRLPCGLAHGWGLTEGSTALTLLGPDEHVRYSGGDRTERFGSIGRPIAGVRVRVVDPGGQDLPPFEPGELLVRSTKAMDGYWKRDEETAAVSHEGWLCTGDIGYADDEGYLFLVDRKKDMLISGGLNVYPSEIERVVRDIAGVKDVAVIGAPDPRWGEVPIAFVVLHPDGPDATQLTDACNAQLARYKVPREFIAVDEIPRNETGKVQRNVLLSRLAVA